MSEALNHGVVGMQAERGGFRTHDRIHMCVKVDKTQNIPHVASTKSTG